jgi:transcriptional regulator with XRE-family HTH domain
MGRKATYIRAWREAKDYTLEQMVGRLAELNVPITAASLSRIERSIQPYSQDLLEAIADALGVTVAQLIEHDPAIPQSEVIDLVQRLSSPDAQRAGDVLKAMFGDNR